MKMKCPYCSTSVNAISGSGKLWTLTNISESYWRCAEGHRYTRARHIQDDAEGFHDIKVEFTDMKFEPSDNQDWWRNRINKLCEDGEEDEKDT